MCRPLAVTLLCLVAAGCGWMGVRPDGRRDYERAKPQFDALMSRLDDPSPHVRAKAEEDLLAALHASNSAMRQMVVYALPRLGERALRPLLGALRDEHPYVRSGAARALGRLRDPRAIGALIEALADAPGAELAAREALVGIGRPAVEALVAALRGPRKRVRWGAAICLAKIRDPRALRALIAALGTKDSHAAAVEALATYGRGAVEPLVAALGSASPLARLGAARALGRLGDPRAVPALIGCLADISERGGVAAAARTALKAIGRPAVDALIGALDSPDPNTRAGAADVLGRIGDARAVPALVAALKDGHAAVRRVGRRALVQVGAPAARRLLAALADPDPMFRLELLGSLEGIRRGEAAGLLLAEVRDARSPARAGAAWALMHVGRGELGRPRPPDKQTLGVLRSAAADGDPFVREALVRALGTAPGPGSVDALLPRLRDGAAGVRSAAAGSLGCLGDRRAVEPLIGALKDEAPAVRAAAAVALGYLCGWGMPRVSAVVLPGRPVDRRAIRPLIVALGDADPGVRAGAAGALGRLADAATREHPALAPLARAIDDADLRVGMAAVRALGALDSRREYRRVILGILFDPRRAEGLRLAALDVSPAAAGSGIREVCRRIWRDGGNPRRLRAAARRRLDAFDTWLRYHPVDVQAAETL